MKGQNMIEMAVQVSVEGDDYNLHTRRTVKDKITLKEVCAFIVVEEEINKAIKASADKLKEELPSSIVNKATVIINKLNDKVKDANTDKRSD